MNDFYTLALSALSVLVVLNLFLTVSVIQRLRNEAPAAMAPPRTDISIPEFSVAAEDGRTLTGGDLASQDEAIIGFFSASCSTCSAQLPEFSQLASALPPGKAITVVTGARDEARSLAAEAGVGTVLIHEDDLGPITRAFNVDGFPTYIKVESGKIVTTAHSHKQLSWPARRA